MNDMKSAARNTVNKCLNIKSDNNILIIIDETTKTIGQELFEAAKEIGAETMIIEMMSRKINGEEPPKLIAEAMKYADVVIAPTKKSLTHTNARINATKNGAKVATMPGITEDMMIRTLNADIDEIARMTEKLNNRINNSKNIRLLTSMGTSITMNFGGRSFIPDNGIIEVGECGNIPSGEVFAAPVEGTSNGVLVVDGSFAGIGMLKQPIKITVEDGYAVKIEGGSQAEELKAMLDSVGRDAYNIAELGIGTNHAAKITGQILEDEKVMGTVHIALGNNAGFGGVVNVPIHLDGIITNPTLIVDDEIIMEDGEFKF